MDYSTQSKLPHNFLAEQSILNILFTNPNLIKDKIIDLKPECFYFESHQILYNVFLECIEKNEGINLTTIHTKLQDKNLLKKVGGLETIISIFNRFEKFTDLPDFIKQVNEKYLRRLIIKVGHEFVDWGKETSEDLEKILENMESRVASLSQKKLSNKIYSSAEILEEVFFEIQSKIKEDTTNGLETSFKDLDSILQGLQKSDLIIIAGRPSMGKTAFSLNLGKNVVEKYNCPLLIFTLEMSRQQIIYRFLTTSSNINSNRLKSGKMTRAEWTNLSKSMKHLSELPIFIDDNPNITLSDIRSKIQKIFNEKQTKGLVIIDYLQLMKLTSNLENRVQEISHITRTLKLFAKEFQIPIILLSQLSRSVESRTNKRPMLSDLRESGCISSSKPLKRQLFSWNQTHLYNNNKINFEIKGIKPTFCITFENNIKIELTSNHKVLSKEGWIAISQIKNSLKIYCLIKRINEKIQFGYNKILNIKYQGLKMVYDKEISVFHNYLQKSILLHNSIEQDADIVIMLYREDYYNEKTLNPQITEFIVAKHRNGPVGTARLLFTPSFTSFKDL